jgi:hypothetical protein
VYSASGGVSAAEDLMPKPVKFVQDWNLKPSVPTGWIKVDQKSAYITSTKSPDVFILMKDQVNLMLAWFKMDGIYWHMVIIESMPIQDIVDYDVSMEHVGLYIKGSKIFLGVEGAEAMTIYEWDQKKRIFSVKVP